MRTIKFRIYNKILEKIIPFEEIEISSADTYLKQALETSDDNILMQFTGLLDKFGKEIYEGDIINVFLANEYCDFEEDEGETKEENDYYNKENAFVCKQEVKWDDVGGYFCDEDTGECRPSLGSDDEVVLEIIGNIFEHSYLLDNK